MQAEVKKVSKISKINRVAGAGKKVTPVSTPVSTPTKPAGPAGPEPPDYTVIVGLRKLDWLPALAAKIRRLDARKAKIEKVLKQIKLQAGELLQKADVKVVMAGGLRVTRIDGVSVSISKTALVENGVDLAVIAKSTERTNWLSCKVTSPGQAKSGGDSE